MRAVSHLSVVQDLRDIAGDRSFKHALRHKFPHVSQSVGDLASEARTRPAPGPRQARTRVFSDVTQFDLTDFTGQKRDLRTMEPVAGEIGHCFVAGQVRRNFRQLSPHRTTGKFFRRGCRLRRQPRHFFPGKNPDLGAGLAGWRLRCRAGAAGLCRAGMWRARRWASPYWASHQTRLGRAIKRGWGEPSNEVGRASTKGPLGETFTVASVANACLALLRCLGTRCPLGTVPARHDLQVPARHVPARHIHLLVPARHVPARRIYLLVPARHCARSARARSARVVTSARSALCLLGTTYKCPLGTVIGARSAPPRLPTAKFSRTDT